MRIYATRIGVVSVSVDRRVKVIESPLGFVGLGVGRCRQSYVEAFGRVTAGVV